MPSTHSRPLIGVGVIVWRGESVLLGERLTVGGDHRWQFPGGHLEDGESVCDCAARELREETGLVLEQAQLAGFTDRQFSDGDSSYITLFVSGECVEGEAEVLEPDKCGGWQWFPCDALPNPLFEPISLYLDQHTDLRAGCRRPGTPAAGRR